jgi:hypothetical protein
MSLQMINIPPGTTWTKVAPIPIQDPNDSDRINWLNKAVLAGATVKKGDHGVAISWKQEFSDQDSVFQTSVITIEGATLRDILTKAMSDLPDPDTLVKS